MIRSMNRNSLTHGSSRVWLCYRLHFMVRRTQARIVNIVQEQNFDVEILEFATTYSAVRQYELKESICSQVEAYAEKSNYYMMQQFSK